MAPDLELIRRLDRVEAESWAAEEEAAGLEGVVLQRFGTALAVISPQRPNTLFNRAVGVETPDQVEAICDWFDGGGVPPRLDVCPGMRTPELRTALMKRGLAPGGFPFFSKRLLAGPPVTDLEQVEGVDVREVRPNDLEAFVRIVAEVWPPSAEERQRALRKTKASSGLPGLRRYLASVDRKPVAAAAIHLRDGVGYLSLAGTLEALRSRGCQTALLRRRVEDAAEAGCDLVFSLVAPGSGSQRNLERAGLSFVCDRELWMPPAWLEHPFYRSAG